MMSQDAGDYTCSVQHDICQARASSLHSICQSHYQREANGYSKPYSYKREPPSIGICVTIKLKTIAHWYLSPLYCRDRTLQVCFLEDQLPNLSQMKLSSCLVYPDVLLRVADNQHDLRLRYCCWIDDTPGDLVAQT
ncbi:hypothetical protein Tco_0044674 [Tanacetum coccineum]